MMLLEHGHQAPDTLGCGITACEICVGRSSVTAKDHLLNEGSLRDVFDAYRATVTLERMLLSVTAALL